MAVSECKKCHKAHLPKLVTYAADIPSKDCAGCHKKAFDLLIASNAKHATLTCSSCHQERHKMTPDCRSCHGSPHPSDFMVKFPRCGDCHKIAHDLNNWPVTEQRGMPKEGDKEGTKRKKAIL
jgi:hypothetical protein